MSRHQAGNVKNVSVSYDDSGRRACRVVIDFFSPADESRATRSPRRRWRWRSRNPKKRNAHPIFDFFSSNRLARFLHGRDGFGWCCQTGPRPRFPSRVTSGFWESGRETWSVGDDVARTHTKTASGVFRSHISIVPILTHYLRLERAASTRVFPHAGREQVRRRRHRRPHAIDRRRRERSQQKRERPASPKRHPIANARALSLFFPKQEEKAERPTMLGCAGSR